MDTDKSGTITYEELKDGLARLGSKLTETEVRQLMDAVRLILPHPNTILFLNTFRKTCVTEIITMFAG